MLQRARLVGVTPSRVVFSLLVAALLVALGAADVPVQAQGGPAPAEQTLIPGRNVNMVSGTKWPDGDPYLQRQNEPSVAASTRNPLHLLAGSNDYRTVDIPNPADGGGETGDAWLGIFKSFDGGQRWQTTLLPGYPQDQSPAGLASPLKGYQAGADPVVRAGTNGLFYYAGLVFDRAENGRSAIFVARFIDNNNREDNYKASRLEPLTGRPQFIREHEVGDPITYLDTAVVASNGGRRFFDKPWMAVDIPRSGQTCAIPGPDGTTQNIPAGDVYVVFSSIDEDARLGLRSEILLTRSSDCGVTWTRPTRISDPRDRINQGATIAIDPRNGTVHVAWRRFASDVRNQPDGLVAVRSTDRGRRFTAPGLCRALTRGNGRKVGLEEFAQYFEHRRKKRSQKPKTGSPVDVTNSLESFDQPTSDVDQMFRTNAYPTMAIDGTGRIYLAWSERGFTSNPANDARIVLSTSPDGRFWTAPVPVANEGQEGHQIMPALVFGGGRLVLVYYDLREDYSGQYTEVIDDRRAILLGGKRHTLDLRASMGLPGQAPQFAPSIRVSDYLMVFKKGAGNTLVEQQAQFNPPNLPMFKQGTAPFMGDYVDVAVAPAFVPTTNGRWAFNTGGALPVFHAVWTDNRDVRQPASGLDGRPDWTKYTAPTQRAAAPGSTSVFDPTAELPACDPQNTGSRNQNVYSARLSMGLVAGSPGNAKPLHPSIQRAFVVFAQNTTDVPKSFRMTIASQPQGGRASFRQFDANATGDDLGPLTTIIVTTPARSTAARSVYATSSNPMAQIPVDVLEVPYGSTVPAVPLSDRVVLNPDIANPDIANPDIANPDIANPDIANAEVYNPDIANPDIANPDIANPDIANPDIANPDIANPDIANPDIANPDIANPDIANPDIANVQVANPDIANPDIANPDIANPDIANPDIANPDIANPDIANSSLTDVTWTMVNNGNTTSAFNVNLFLSQDATAQICADGEAPVGTTGCISTQLIVRKVYNTPTTTGCELQVQAQNVVVTNIQNPRFVTPGQPLPDQNDSAEENATVWLAPGETAKITLRVYDPNKSNNVGPADNDPATPTDPANLLIDPIFLPTTETSLGSVTPVIQQQAVDTQDVQTAATNNAPPPAPPIITPLSPPVPSGESQPEDSEATPLWLAFVQQPPAVQVGAAFSTTVRVLDQYGNPLPNAVVTLFVGANPNPQTTPVLTGNTATSDGDGIAAFGLPDEGHPGVTLSPAAVGYTLVATAGQALPAVSNTFIVTAIPASVTLGNLTQTYSGSALAPTWTTSPVAELPVSLAYSQGGAAASPVNAGSYDVVATITNPNYAGGGIGTLVINKATPVITWAPPAAIAQGTPLSGTQLNATATIGAATVPGSFAYTPTAGTSMNTPGSQTLWVTFTPTDEVNYTTATASVPISVEQATPAGLRGRWSADGTPLDSVGGNHGILIGGASYGVGRIGPAFSVSNLPAGGQYVRVVDDASLQMTTAMTMSAWIYPTTNGVGGNATIVNKEGEYEFARFPNGSIGWAFSGVGGAGYAWTIGTPQNAAPLNTWTHVAVTYAGGTVVTYVNGAPVSTVTGAPAPIGDFYPSLNELWIGGRQSFASNSEWFDGRIDEVGIYNTALTPAEVLAIYNEAPPLLGSVWSASGNGTVTLLNNGSTGTPTFSYDNPGVFTGTWTMSTVAAATGTVDLTYAWNGFHSYFSVTTGLDVFVNRGGTDVFVLPLINDGPNVCCVTPSAGFGYNGATSVTVQAGDTFGFRLRGSHGDGTYAMSGTLSLVVGGTPAFAVNVRGTAGGNEEQSPGYGSVPVRVYGGTLAAGQQVTITATGLIQRSAGAAPSGPDGIGGTCSPACLANGVSGAALVARIGGGPWQFVGAGPTVLTATSAGLLEFGVNDDVFTDNTGAFVATVSWTAGPTLFSETVITSDSSILNDGLLMAANNLGSSPSAVTVNGVPFGTDQGGLTGPWGAGGGEFSLDAFSAELDAVLSTLQFSGTLVPVSFEIDGLTPGANYRLQLLFSNDLNTTGDRVNITVAGATWSLDDWQPNAINLTVQFTATSPSAVITFAPGAGSDGQSGRAVLNGYVIHQMAP